jgi:hypothetical protein
MNRNKSHGKTKWPSLQTEPRKTPIDGPDVACEFSPFD